MSESGIELFKRFMRGEKDAEDAVLMMGYERAKTCLWHMARGTAEQESLALSAVASQLRQHREGKVEYLNALLGFLRCTGTVAKRKWLRRRYPRTKKAGKGVTFLGLDNPIARESEADKEGAERDREQVDGRLLLDTVAQRLGSEDLRATLQMYREGKEKSEIADARGVSVRTVENWRKKIDDEIRKLCSEP